MNAMKKNNSLSIDQLLALLDIYESEWQHRNNLLWSQVFKLFYFSIFIIAFPVLSGGLGYNIPIVSSLIFPIVGIIAAFFSYYMSISYALRLRAARDSVNKLINFLPMEYSLIKLSEIKHGKFFMARQTFVIPTVFFFVEVVLAFILFYCIKNGLL